MTNSRKNILALASWYPSRVFLDNGDFIQRHLRAISILNNVTLVHAVKDPNLKSEFEIIDSLNTNVREIVVYYRPSIFTPFNLIKQIRAFLKGVSLVKEFDLIHLNVIYPAGLVATILKKIYRKPIILTEHWTVFTSEHFKKLPLYKRIFFIKILKYIDFVTPVSKDLYQKIYNIYSIENCKIIPNVVDIELFSIKDEYCKAKKKFLHLSNLRNEHKNILGMINVAKRLVDNGYDFEFQIGGNGDLSMITNFIIENKLSFYIKPFERLEHSDVNQKMKNVDCFVLFSNYENQPCVQIEAFASGIPVIASNVGGISEFFPEGFGKIIESENEEQLYCAMKDFIENKMKIKSEKEISEFAKEHFSMQKIAQQFDEVYTEVLK